ncbi:uncharacterized protein LOC142818967 [Pelodiscus sinensis]|uniref:uncharacterized protein LOC142818967 n=1 Tax=Pelodiscus sinensis TaxID=13735 RepID=UPI003F6CF44B
MVTVAPRTSPSLKWHHYPHQLSRSKQTRKHTALFAFQKAQILDCLVQNRTAGNPGPAGKQPSCVPARAVPRSSDAPHRTGCLGTGTVDSPLGIPELDPLFDEPIFNVPRGKFLQRRSQEAGPKTKRSSCLARPFDRGAGNVLLPRGRGKGSSAPGNDCQGRRNRNSNARRHNAPPHGPPHGRLRIIPHAASTLTGARLGPIGGGGGRGGPAVWGDSPGPPGLNAPRGGGEPPKGEEANTLTGARLRPIGGGGGGVQPSGETALGPQASTPHGGGEPPKGEEANTLTPAAPPQSYSTSGSAGRPEGGQGDTPPGL